MLIPWCEITNNNRAQLPKPVNSATREWSKGWIKASDTTKLILLIVCNVVNVARDATLWAKNPNRTNTEVRKFVIHAARWFPYSWKSKTWSNLSSCGTKHIFYAFVKRYGVFVALHVVSRIIALAAIWGLTWRHQKASDSIQELEDMYVACPREPDIADIAEK